MHCTMFSRICTYFLIVNIRKKIDIYNNCDITWTIWFVNTKVTAVFLTASEQTTDIYMKKKESWLSQFMIRTEIIIEWKSVRLIELFQLCRPTAIASKKTNLIFMSVSQEKGWSTEVVDFLFLLLSWVTSNWWYWTYYFFLSKE
jgi:hypothetical protein